MCIRDSCSGDTYLRRPISIAEAENGYVRIIFQIKGKGTALLAEKKEGDKINVLGPLGPVSYTHLFGRTRI